MNSKRICLITSAHVSYNPRLMKEADALHEAGYGVRVVAVHAEAAKGAFDDRLMAARKWRLETLNVCPANPMGRWRWCFGTLRQRLHQRRFQSGGGILEKVYYRYHPELCRLVARESADLFLAHNLPALPVAAFAAMRWRARLGFDAEDFHRGEIAESDSANALTRRLTMEVEQKYIPRCNHLSAASDGIGDAYARAVGVCKPVTVLNVFSLSERNGQVPVEELQRERRGGTISLYWYSQVIGADRGLDDALKALAVLPSDVHLHLRGGWAVGCEGGFREKMRQLGIEHRVHILPPAPPEQLVERAAQHDVGLALEMGHTENRRIAVTNKILLYFLSGLAIAASDVSSQRSIMESAPDAGFLYPPGNDGELARRLRIWTDDPKRLRAAREESRALGESRFCWDKEKQKLLEAVARVLNGNRAMDLGNG